MKVLLGVFNRNLREEDIFKPTIVNESLHQVSNDNGVKIVNFTTSKKLAVKSMMFPHKYTCTCPDGKNNNQIFHIMIDRRWHSSMIDMRSCRRADCNTDHYLVVAIVKVRLAVVKQTAQKSDVGS
jgi:hypothetical protein